MAPTIDSVGQVGQPETPGMIKEALAPDRQETFLPSSPCSTGCVPRSAQFVLTASVLSAPMAQPPVARVAGGDATSGMQRRASAVVGSHVCP
ncbi:hypothetical protein MRX96_020568 [Rhipicephalus microplus]